MRKIAIYGKGGIGKSTVSSNLSAALALKGHKVMQVGCDPKADSTINLTGGMAVRPILEQLRVEKNPSLNSIVSVGFGGVHCAECGGPKPGVGCAGRGIITAFDYLEKQNAFDQYQVDYVIYDVLGDVVCGGFALPIREGYAEDVYIVTSGEKMSMYAARNIALAIDQYKARNYARLAGIIFNSRNLENEKAIVEGLSEELEVPILASVPRSREIHRWEHENKTVVEGDMSSDLGRIFMDLAEAVANGSTPR